MKKLLLLFSLLAVSLLHSQEYEVLSVSSGYNEDVIANGSASASTVTTTGVDDANWAYMSTDYVSPSDGAAAATAIPADGLVSNGDVDFEFGDFSENNSLRIQTSNSSGTLSFSNQVNATNLYFLVTSGSGASTVSAEVLFTDGTSQTFTGLSVADWYNGGSPVLQGLGRVRRNDDNIELNSTNPRIYQLSVALATENQTKLVSGVEFTKTSAGTSVFNVFAASAQILPECPAPTNIASSNVGTESATLSWDAPSVTPSSYEYYYSTSNVDPDDTTTVSGTTTDTSVVIDGLSATTSYYFWVRSACGTDTTSSWTGPYSFDTEMCPVDEQCTYTFYLSDSYGDGWNGNTLNVIQNGVTVADVTLPVGEEAGIQEVTLCDGVPFSIYWTGGSWSYEVSFNIVSNYTGEQILSVPTYSTSLVGTTIYTGYSVCSVLSCPQPTDLSADEITAYTAELSWTEAGSATQWEVIVLPAGSDFPAEDAEGVVTEDNDPYLIEELDSYTEYEYYVKALCGAGDESFWSGPYEFMTEVSCPQPVNIVVSDVVYDAATATWEAGAEETTWEVAIMESGAGEPTSWITVSDNPTYTFDDLDGLTDYVVYVRAYCEEDDQSFWSLSATFETPISNDECNNPIEVPVNATEDCTQVTTVSFEGATVSGETSECADNNSGDIWYSFVALGTTHEIEMINPTPLATTTVYDDVVLTLYDGTCGDLTMIYCTSVNNILATDLEPGSTYLLRIIDNTTAVNNTGFDLCINTPELPANQDSFACSIRTINSDFEVPDISGVYPPVLDENMIQGWRTTAADGQIEVWPTPNFEDVPGYSGDQFIELNANLEGGVYQDYETPAATTFTYSFAHRARRSGGLDVCRILSGSPDDDLADYTVVGTFSADNTSWVVNTGTFTTPDDQPVTRFIFEAVSTVTNDNSVGNFLDAVSFIADNSITVDNPMTIDCDDIDVAITAAGGGSWSVVDGNPSETVIADPDSNSTTISGFTLPGTYYYEWNGTYCSSTLEIVYDIYVVEFNYDATEVCYDGEDFVPTLADGFTMGGTFTSTEGLVLDATTGEINTGESTPGTYTVTYTVDTGGVATTCDTEYSVDVTIFPPVEMAIVGGCSGVAYMLTATPLNENEDLTGVTYDWSGPNGFTGDTQEVQAIYEGDYTVVVTSANGCSYESSLSVESTYCAIPQGISPQGDQYNQDFDLTGLNVSKLEIFNRLGKKVYTQTNYTDQWHGQTDEGEILPVGTYFYVLYFSDGKDTKTGWVYINY
ncbi:gliding motility-associated C-terminal domain-containing protein [Pustulibacterium marinum]|uniref:Gliding motility-associated C-terminal domain-containing protein n=1 Tax=Pustulibacterium marinum TaxID=1224947 RepID=A0A1I7GJI9_9FLAO|nr:fibronectin type III domain-containing protein [Pustulibacterium marinum]SFU48608.1 gliding motility-associated C-terminal domain-containing protein [Pustulibacterium marinum]